MDSNETPTALTIAGSDSGGGAGIQADLKTFSAHGVFGTTAITAVTAQNTVGVSMIEAMSPAMVTAQIDAVAADIPPRATKIGMLANAGIIAGVADALARHRLPNVVLDTVMVAKSQARLLDDDAVDALVTLLVPMATVVTPNVPELEALTGMTIRETRDLHLAAARLIERGARAVLAKGGHLQGPAVDVLVWDGRSLELTAERIETSHTHGTGCTFSAAIAARLAKGDDLEAAVRGAKEYVTRAIALAPGLGRGHGPLHHFPVEGT
ncbi:MAG TPA: bifunctional hydroxymethylpyrimidine kinase/phosphomethylpyrimidine kinase [Vicinamibacterales bacterium]|nr:bifunctional hydroxymethylpyrimidine kinase/phosphomethylpyrimidine kinase [Vicinamibacterales bacterium]